VVTWVRNETIRRTVCGGDLGDGRQSAAQYSTAEKRRVNKQTHSFLARSNGLGRRWAKRSDMVRRRMLVIDIVIDIDQCD
jgi:ribosomal protein S6E (S10)